jgi:hypothetical protein
LEVPEVNPALAWLGIGVTLALGGVVPCVVTLVRLRRDVDGNTSGIADLDRDVAELKADRRELIDMRQDLAITKNNVEWIRSDLEKRKP